MIIIETARKHYKKERLSDEDVIHAIRYFIFRVDNFEEIADKILYIGTDLSTRLLEVIIVERRDGEEVVIHAQKLTKKYIHYITDYYDEN
jgi:hypothetical protein